MSDQHGQHPHVKYWIIFALLCVFTGLSWIADEAKTRHILTNYAVITVIVLAVASAKALLVMMYFMHLKFEGRWKYVLLSPTIILAIGLPLALWPDIAEHYYTTDVPQDGGRIAAPRQVESSPAPAHK